MPAEVSTPILSRLFALLQENPAYSLATLAGRAGCSRETATIFRQLYLQWRGDARKEATHATCTHCRQ